MAVLLAVLAVFYLVLKRQGGTGVRTEGRTLMDKPVEDDNPPPG
jgi:hypothetical protein